MPHLRIAIGYRTAHRDPSQAVVLGTGTDKAALQAAIDAAPADLVRFEFGVFTPVRKATRNSNHNAIAAVVDETHDKSTAAAPSEEASASAAGDNQPHSGSSAEEGDGDEDLSLGGPAPASPRMKRR